jgi:CUB/sushi domain-containing protein
MKFVQQCAGWKPWATRHTRLAVFILLTPMLFRNTLAACGDYPAVDNSYNDASGGPPFASGVTITYTCRSGFLPDGLNKVTCNGDQWDPFNFMCRPVNCGEPPSPENGRRIGNLYTFGEEVTFECDEGYILEGRTSTFCMSNQQWSNPTPVCNAVTCPAVVTPEHGKVFPTSKNSYGDEVRYTCDSGYEWTGTVWRTCQADRTWSGDDGVCQVVDCGEPADLYGVTFSSIPEGSTQHGTVITFSCVGDAELVGESLAECLIDGQWTEPTPKCYQKCSSVAVENGVFNGQARSSHNAAAQFSCDSGYRGHPSFGQVICNNGTWSPNTPECREIPKCPDPGLPANATRSREPPYYVDDKLTFTCPTGFNIKGSATLTCQNDKTWTTHLPACQQVTCPPLAAPDHGWFQPNDSITYGVTVHFYCYEKYLWSERSNERQCGADGQWTGSAGQCSKQEVETEPSRAEMRPVSLRLLTCVLLLLLLKNLHAHT